MDKLKKAKKIFKSPGLIAIFTWSRPVRWPIIGLCLTSVIVSLLSLGMTLVTKNLIDGATSANAHALWVFGTALIALTIIQRLLLFVNARLRLKADTQLQKSMQNMITASVMGKEYAALKPYHSGELVSRIFSDVSVVQNGVMNLLPSLLSTFFSFVGATIILATMDWRFIVVVALAGGICAIVSIGFSEPMKARHKRVQDASAKLHASTQENLENIRVIKASSSEERALDTMNGYRDVLLGEQLKNGNLSIMMNQGFGIMFSLSWLICNLWGCVKIYQGTFTYGSLAALIQLIGRIQNPIANAVNLASQMYGVVASAERLQEVLDLPDEEQGTTLNDFDKIMFHNVNFQYDDGVDDVLIDVNAEINKGDFVALTGISGGGKTSLFQLLLGIYKPTSGDVLFTQGDLTVSAARGTRGIFAYVPQGNMLFSGTLRENLTMFTDIASQEDIEEAVKAACLDEVIASVGYDAMLGERGIGLSEGQAQRVAVARALLSKAPILLLDEATSALDENTEATMLNNISAMRDKTVIIVTHRPAALAICDYHLHIADGKVTRMEGAEA